MTEAIVGTPSVVGLGNGNECNSGVRELLGAVDRSQHTQSILAAQRHDTVSLRDAVQANAVAIEKTAAAVNLAVEKTAAAALANAQCCCEIKELIRADGEKTRDLVNEIERARQAVLLQDCKTDLILAKLGAVQGNARP